MESESAEIVPGLIVGSEACVATLTGNGAVAAVVAAVRQPQPEADTVQAMLHIKIKDKESQSMLEPLQAACKFLTQWHGDRNCVTAVVSDGPVGPKPSYNTTHANPRSVLIYCQQGISRSVTICTGYLVYSRRLTPREALNVVQSARSQALPNAGFCRQLETWFETCCLEWGGDAAAIQARHVQQVQAEVDWFTSLQARVEAVGDCPAEECRTHLDWLLSLRMLRDKCCFSDKTAKAKADCVAAIKFIGNILHDRQTVSSPS